MEESDRASLLAVDFLTGNRGALEGNSNLALDNAALGDLIGTTGGVGDPQLVSNRLAFAGAEGD